MRIYRLFENGFRRPECECVQESGCLRVDEKKRRNYREFQIERILCICGPVRKITKVEGKSMILFLVSEYAKTDVVHSSSKHFANVCKYT